MLAQVSLAVNMWKTTLTSPHASVVGLSLSTRVHMGMNIKPSFPSHHRVPQRQHLAAQGLKHCRDLSMLILLDIRIVKVHPVVPGLLCVFVCMCVCVYA